MLKPESIVRHLRSYQRRSRDAVVDDFETYMVVQRLLQLAVQCVVDLSSHIQVALDLEPVDDYEQAILSLGWHGILPRDFAERICKMAGFCNVLVVFIWILTLTASTNDCCTAWTILSSLSSTSMTF